MKFTKVELPEDIAKKKIILCKEEAMFLGCEGESILCGVPMMWCRTSTCNLRCSWFDKEGDIVVNCDTQHTSHFPRNKTIVTCQELYDWFLDPEYDHIEWISVSGGEPFMQPNLIAMLDYVVDSGKKVKIETNSTIFIPSKANMIMMSPKLKSSSSGLLKFSDPTYTKPDIDGALEGMEIEKRTRIYQRFLDMHEKDRYNMSAMKEIVEHYQDRHHFKFVVNEESDLQEILEKFVEPLSILPSNISLMAQGINTELLNNKARWIIEEICLKKGWRYSDRIHVRVYGNEMGV